MGASLSIPSIEGHGRACYGGARTSVLIAAVLGASVGRTCMTDWAQVNSYAANPCRGKIRW